MGKKTRTRRTKWRRLSLGDASGPEEDEDEPQTVCANQQQTEAEDDNQKIVNVLVSGEEEELVEELCDSVVSVSVSAVSTATAATAIMPGPGQSTEEMALSQPPPHHHNQRSSGWKPPAKAQQQQQQTGGYYNTNGRQSTATLAAQSAAAANGYRRANSNGGGGQQRYGNGPSSGGGYNNGCYGRANSWNTNGSYNGGGDHHHSHHHSQQQPAGALGKTHGIEKKIFNDEEYTKISTPRQEVLFKKGSIGAKKRLPVPAATDSTTPTTVPTSDDNGNASSSPTSPPSLSVSASGLNSEADCFQYTGGINNDSGSTGDASSTTGELVGSDGAAAAALSGGYGDGAPLVCIPMYDFYGPYGGMYPGSTMLVQTYPGGPLVAAVPVQMPLYTGAQNPGGNGTGGSAAGGSHEMTTGFYYTLGYPTAASGGAELATIPYDAASHGSRRNSLESYQASSSQEGMTMSETSSSSSSSSASENNSPCSTGPSSQGPASPQGELVSAPIDAKAQAAAAAAVMADMALVDLNSHHHHQQQQLQHHLQQQQHHHHHQRGGNQGKMTVAGFVYPAYPYGLAPPALYASAGCDAAAAAFFYDNLATEYYYDDDGFLVAVDEGLAAAGLNCDPFGDDDDGNNGNQLAEEDVDSEIGPDAPLPLSSTKLKEEETEPVALVKPVEAAQPAAVDSGRRKKKRKRRKRRANSIQPQRVTDDVAADNDDEPDGEEEEEEVTDDTSVCVSSIISLPPTESPPPLPTATCDLSPATLPTVEVEEEEKDKIIVDASPEPSTTPTAAAEKEEETSLVSTSVMLTETNQVSTTTSNPITIPVLDTLFVPSEPKSSNDEPPAQELSGRSISVDQLSPSTESIQQQTEIQSDPVVSFNVSLPQSSSSSVDNDHDKVVLIDEENSEEEIRSIESDSLASDQQLLLPEAMDRDSLDRDENCYDDDFVQLHLPEDDFDREPLLPRQVQLWRTVILEESEPESKELSIHSSMDGNDDSGIAASSYSSPISSSCAGPGPISQAVSQWLQSAPIQQQLIASTLSSLVPDEDEEENGGGDDDGLSDYEEDEVTEQVPKNGLFDPCTAPSSDQSVTDGPQLRVESDKQQQATGGDLLPEEEEEPLDRPLGPDCDPAKYSVYYQLGVSELEEDGEEDEQMVKAEEAIQPCPLPVAEQTATDSTNKATTTKKDGATKRKWRRILLARRAVHNNKSDKTKRLRSGQSCCAVQ